MLRVFFLIGLLCFAAVPCMSGCGSSDATVLTDAPVNPPTAEELAAKEREMEKH